MALGAAAIALATASPDEHRRWAEAAGREGVRYGVDPAYVRSGLTGEGTAARRRTWLDWAVVIAASAVFVGFGLVARVPELAVRGAAMVALVIASLALLGGTGWLLWKTTGFN